MNTVATTTISILRGTTTDAYGDTVEAATVVHSGIPASVIEQRRIVTTESDPTPRSVAYFTGRVRADVDIRNTDRIRDENTNAVYIVDSAHQVASPVMTNDIRLDLRRTTA